MRSLLAALVMSSLLACSNDVDPRCLAICQRAHCSTGVLAPPDCTTQCRHPLGAAQCPSQYDALLTCEERLSDAALCATPCPDEYDRYRICRDASGDAGADIGP